MGTPESWLGRAAALGDLDNDGRDDLIATRSSDWHLLPGGTWGADHPVAPEWPVTGLDMSDGLSAGDVDGDGLRDLAMVVLTDNTDVTIAVWPGSTNSFDASLADADTLAFAPGMERAGGAGSISVFDADQDGYEDVWFAPRVSGFFNAAYAADGSALGRGEVLGAADFLRMSDADNVTWALPSSLGDGEGARLVARFYRTDEAGEMEAKGLLTFPASRFARGATLDAETGTLLYEAELPSTVAAGDWNGNGLPDLAIGVDGDVVDVGDRRYAPEQFVLLLLDP